MKRFTFIHKFENGCVCRVLVCIDPIAVKVQMYEKWNVELTHEIAEEVDDWHLGWLDWVCGQCFALLGLDRSLEIRYLGEFSAAIPPWPWIADDRDTWQQNHSSDDDDETDLPRSSR